MKKVNDDFDDEFEEDEKKSKEIDEDEVFEAEEQEEIEKSKPISIKRVISGKAPMERPMPVEEVTDEEMDDMRITRPDRAGVNIAKEKEYNARIAEMKARDAREARESQEVGMQSASFMKVREQPAEAAPEMPAQRYNVFNMPERFGIVDAATQTALFESHDAMTVVLLSLADIINRLDKLETNLVGK